MADSDLVEAMRRGNRYALARLISQTENRTVDVLQLMDRLHAYVRSVPVIGITGPPGAGKSTFVDLLIGRYRHEGKRVAVIAIDPSSPFSGGAILGDRIRMQQHAMDDGVFIRSLSTRGHFGGLTVTTSEVIKLFDVAGYDVVLVETVGVGQTEFAAMTVADTVVVVLVPESGDTVQTLKAGLLEIADIFVVNKADRDGAERLQSELRSMTQLKLREDAWEIPILLMIARTGQGVDRVFEAIESHRSQRSPDARRLALARRQDFLEIVQQEVYQRISTALANEKGPASELLTRLMSKEINPYGAARELLGDPHRLSMLLKAGISGK